MKDANYWSENVKTSYHPPEGTFSQPAPEVIRTLLNGAENDPHLALHRLIFYINRSGKNLNNLEELEKVKQRLEKLIQQEKKH